MSECNEITIMSIICNLKLVLYFQLTFVPRFFSRMFHRYENNCHGGDTRRWKELLPSVRLSIDFDLLALSAHNRIAQYQGKKHLNPVYYKI